MSATLWLGILFTMAWLTREWQWAREREKLLDRIMARSLPEFKHEERKADIMRKKPEPKPFPSDAELAQWELKHTSQVAENSKELDAALTDLQRKASSVVQPQRAAGVSHGS